MTERTRVELRDIGGLQEEHKQILEDRRENIFRQNIMSLFQTCLEECSLKAALNGGGLMSVTV